MHPLWLLIDTACPRALVALTRESRILAECYLEEQQKQGENLARAIDLCLSKAELSISDIRAIAVGQGPGSFIGVRIGMAHAKGLCLALQIPLVGFNTLAAFDPQGCDYVALDARRQEFYVLDKTTGQIGIRAQLPESTHLELKGPTAEQAVRLLPMQFTDQTLTLTPYYLRDNL